MNTRQPQFATSVLALAILSIAVTSGCGEKGPELYKVSGRLTHNGAPISEIEVVFLPDDTGQFRESMATTDAEGKFEMMCSSSKGVAPGNHTVYVRDPAAIHGEQTSDDPDYVAVIEKYGDEKTSPKKVTIESDQTDYELNLD